MSILSLLSKILQLQSYVSLFLEQLHNFENKLHNSHILNEHH